MKVDKNIKHRDNTIRSYIISRNWDINPEFLLVREVIQNLVTRKPELSDFKYVYDYEWEVETGLSNKGKGDLVFTDGKNNFLIVECKNKNSQEVRKQTIDYMKKFEEIQKDAKVVRGMAVTPERWDLVSHESPYWDLDIKESERPYYELFDDLDNPDEIKKRDKFQEIYKNLGLMPNNPINVLKELEDQAIIEIVYKESEDIIPPFECEVWIKILSDLPGESYYGKAMGSKKKEAKVFACANICDQIFLPYHTKDWQVPIKVYKKLNTNAPEDKK